MGNWNSSSGTGTTDDAYSSGPGQNYSSSTTSSSTNNGNDNNGRESYTDRFGGTSTRNFNLSDNTPTTTDDFFQGTFDDPGEPGFSGPSYSGQFGYDSSGDYYGPGDVDVTGPYSPVSRGTRAPTPFDVALGRTPPRPQSPTPGFPSLINMVEAQNRNLNTMSVGDGFERAPVYSRGPLVDTGRTVAGVPISAPVGPLTMTRGPVYAGTNVPTQVTSEMAQDILTATGSPYASLAYDRPREPNLLERVMGFDEGYVLSPERVPGTGIEVSTVTDSKEIVESAISLSGITTTFAGRAMFGDINAMDVQSLVTGEEGVYTDIGGLIGAMTNTDGRSIAFGDDRYGDGNTNNGSSGDTYVSSVPTPGPTLARRFRSRQTFSPIRSMRFPSAPAVSAPSPRFPAAEGGYIDTDYVSDGILNKKRGFHSFSVGGRAFVVAPDINNPVQYKAYGGTIEEAKNAMGGVFGYDPQTIDLGKFPGEQGFGEDLQNFQPGVGGTTVNGQFVSSIGEMQQPIPMAVGGPAGFVGDRPENVPEQKTVADDVPMDVPEGTFVLSASAAEHMGSKDVENMLNEAKDVLKKAGVDISSIEATMTKEVPLAVSVGEVIIPPVLAKIIGYDRLEKINNRGKAEVERRQQNQSSPIDQQMQQVAYAAKGGIQNSVGQDMLVSNSGYSFNSVQDIDQEAESIFGIMRGDLNTRLKEVDLSLPFEDKVKARSDLTQEVLSQYHDRLRKLKESSDPYAFQQFQDRHADKLIALQNELDFGDYTSEREKNLAEKASFFTQIPLGASDNKLLPETQLVGVAEPYVGRDGDKVAYVAGKKTEDTDPSSTARHETAHLEFKGREKERLSPIEVDGTTFVLNEEQMLRLLDLDRAKSEGLEGEYDRAMKFITRGGRNKIRPTGFGAYMRLQGHLTQEEIENNLPEIIKQIEEQQKF